MLDDKRWYALYTKPRWEKKVHQILQEKGMESYCPLNKVRKKWSDRYKVVNEPLFKSYVFVKLKEIEKPEARLVNGVVNFVYWNGKPAQIREQEILLIRKFLNEYECLEVAPISFSEQQKVKFSRGVLMDEEGIITGVEKNRIQVMLTSLGYKLVATVNKHEVIPLQD